MAYDKLVDSSQLNSDLGDVADAIRAKSGGSSQLAFPSGFISEIGNISTGGGGSSITDGIVVKARNANGFATEIDYYGNCVFSYQFYNRSSSEGAWVYLNTINCKNQISVLSANAFTACGNLTQFDMTHITSLSAGALSSCGIVELDFQNLETLPTYALQSSLAQTVMMPKITGLGVRVFWKMTSLTSCTVGSVGHGVTSINTSAFEGCTNQNLIVTIYTTGSYANTAVANTRNGATKATIIIKASETTTYDGTTYNAGDTILTSEVT